MDANQAAEAAAAAAAAGSKDEMVEITWSGKKLFLYRSQLDDWYNQSFEARDNFVENHKYLVHDNKIKNFDKKKKPKAELPDLSGYVVVHWCGKSICLKREMVEEWYQEGPEGKIRLLADNPDSVIKFEGGSEE